MSKTTDKNTTEIRKTVVEKESAVQAGPEMEVDQETPVAEGTDPEASAPAEQVEKKSLRITSLTAVVITVLLAIAAIMTAAAVHDSRAAKEQKAKAEEFAAVLLDTLQSKGQERVQEQFWNGFIYNDEDGEQRRFDGMPFDIVDDYDRMGPSGSDFQIYDKKEGATIPETGNPQRYTILGASWEGSDYDVQIKYDPSGYGDDKGSDSHAYNVNSFPDTRDLTSESTAVINPEGAYVSFDTDVNGEYEYDDTSQQFRSETRTLESSAMDRIFQKRATFYEEISTMISQVMNLTEIHNWHEIEGTAFYNDSDKSQKIPELQKLTTRNTTILAEGGSGSADVTSSVIFKLTDPSFIGDPDKVIQALPEVFKDATVTVTVENEDGTVTTTEEPVSPERIDELTKIMTEHVENIYKAATTDRALTEQFMVYESDRPFYQLDSIYLMYYPLRNAAWKSDTISIDISDVRNQYKTDDKLELYIVPQLGLLASNRTSYESIQASDYIAPKLAGGTISYDDSQLASIEGEGGLFDMSRIRVNYIKGYLRTLAAADMKDSITTDKDPEDIIYNLSVRIYKASEGRFSKGGLIADSSVTSS